MRISPAIFVPYGIPMDFFLTLGSTTFFGERKEGVARLEFTKEPRFKPYSWDYMRKNTAEQTWHRLESKKLDTQFLHTMIHGLSCSPFEASAILDSVYRIYAPYFETSGTMKPGQVLFQVLSIENGPNIAIKESKQVTVTLTMDDPQKDIPVRKQLGVIGLRHHRIQRVCVEAFQQGGVLTVEDLAYRLFNCGQRTICRDLQFLRSRGIQVPLRSVITDMGRTLSHRATIIEQWLKGSEYSDIARRTFHSVSSVSNYVDKFKRVVALSSEEYDVNTIAFLVKLSAPLVETYFHLWRESVIVPHRKKELASLGKKNTPKNRHASRG